MNKDICEINFIGLTHDHTSMRDNVVELTSSDTENTAANGKASKGGDLQQQPTDELCSAISILKRHPKYDCLVLVKKYRRCLDGYALEFPIDRIRESERIPTNESAKHNTLAGQDEQEGENKPQDKIDGPRGGGNSLSACSQRRLVSRFLDGDDPMYSPALLYTMSSHSISALQDTSDDDSSSSSLRRQPQQQHVQFQQQASEANGNQAGAGADDDSTIMNETDQVTVECVEVPFMKQIDDKGEQCDLVHVPVNGLLDRLELYTRNGIAVDSRVYAFAMGLKTAERMMTTKSMKELQETPI